MENPKGLMRSSLKWESRAKWKILSRNKDTVRKRRALFPQRVGLISLDRVESVITRTVEKLGHRRWRRWLISWVLCLVGGMDKDMTPRDA